MDIAGSVHTKVCTRQGRNVYMSSFTPELIWKIIVIQNVACGLVDRYQQFRRILITALNPALKAEGAGSSEMFVSIYETTRRYTLVNFMVIAITILTHTCVFRFSVSNSHDP
jgi:hypothetical protein